MSEITYIYTLSHPITKEIRYVGKSIKPKERYKDHIKSGKSGRRKNLVNNWIKSLLSENLKPKMDIIDEVEGEWEWLEQYWISQFKCWGFRLKNMTEGGENNPMSSLEARKKISNIMKNIKKSKEWCDNISKAKKGVSIHTEKSKNLLSESNGGENNPMYGKKHDLESLKKMGEKVIQYDLHGNLIKTWYSCAEAARNLCDSCRGGHINRCARGERKTAYGYKWSYENNKGRVPPPLL
jgi:group I intron endonuclease